MYILPIYLLISSCIITFLFGKFLSRGCIFINVNSIIFSLIYSILIFYEVFILHATCNIHLFNWIHIDSLQISLSILFDSLSSLMSIVVLIVSLCAHVYSIEYMSIDPHKIRFFSYLSLFTFTMLLLITSSNIVQLFFGWEAVGITSYLLINFWSTRIQANKAAILAVMANKIGDISLLFSSIFIFINYKTIYFNNISHLVDIFGNTSCEMFLYNDWNAYGYYIENQIGNVYITFINNLLSLNIWDITNIYIYTYVPIVICILLLIAAICKSAQFGFHFWLSEAMEGPTPVSSLLHAATMVTAGIYLIIRTSFLFDYSTEIPIFTIFIGSITAFIASIIGATQYDLKKIIAYSTCSQLGYMFLSNGIFSYNFTMFHLFNHAFFKALLFLAAGYIIHLFSNEQDIRKMGGLFKISPLSYISILIASFSLMGIPYMSGFYSKDAIVELFNSFTLNVSIIHYDILLFSQIILTLSVSITIFYSIKVLYYVFLNFNNSFNKYIQNIHFGNIAMLSSLILLSILSICSGYFTSDLLIGEGNILWGNSINLYHVSTFGESYISLSRDLAYTLITREFNTFTYYYLFINTIYINIICICIFFFCNNVIFLSNSGIATNVFRYKKDTANIKNNYSYQWRQFYITHFNLKLLFLHRIIITKILHFIFVESYVGIYKLIDKNIFEIVGPFGIASNLITILNKIDKITTDKLYHYGGLIVILFMYVIVHIFINTSNVWITNF